MSRLQVDISDDNFEWLKKEFPRKMSEAVDRALSYMRAWPDGDYKTEDE